MAYVEVNGGTLAIFLMYQGLKPWSHVWNLNPQPLCSHHVGPTEKCTTSYLMSIVLHSDTHNWLFGYLFNYGSKEIN